jgi:hypothetical protein
MSIFLYRCRDDQDFSETVHTEWPLKLLDLTVEQGEGRVAVAGLVLPVSEEVPSDGWAFIATDDRGHLEPILKGQFVGLPKRIDDHTKFVELVATPATLRQQVHQLRQSLEQDHGACFLLKASDKGSDSIDLADYLEFRQDLFCYDRITHQVSLSSLFEGRVSQEFGPQILQDSLNFRLTDTPLPGIELTLVCEWVQELQGEINLFPKIEHQFPQGRLNTLSPKDLVDHWPQTGRLLGRSGYAVVRGFLKEFIPSSTGLLGIYPTTTPLIQGKTYRQFWLEGELTLDWTYRQKRQERLEVRLHHRNQYLSSSNRPYRKLNLKLNHLMASRKTQSRFFETEAGQKALSRALDIAKSHLAYSARAAEVTFQVAFQEALDITLDHQVTVHHPSLPGGKLTGKVTRYRFMRTFDRAIAQITVAMATGTGASPLSFNLEWHSCDPLEGVEGEQEGESMTQLTPDHFIESLTVYNPASDQIAWVQAQEEPPKVLPPDLSTRIEMHLKDLRSSDVLERKFRLKDLYWGAPNHLNPIGETR